MRTTLSISILLLCSFVSQAVAQDTANSTDHPVITRYPGQTIAHFNVKQFDQYNLVLSVNRTGAPDKVDKLEGKVTRITYRNPAGRSTTEIFRNFEDALKAAGAQIFFSCSGRDCGTPIRWTAVNGIRDMGGIIHNRYVAARVRKSGEATFLSIFVGGQSTQLDVIEPKPVETGLVTVNAAAMAAGIDAEGHIALYSILFDTGKSTLKPESRSAIEEIAKLLKSRPALRLFVVGHTDGTGGFEMNLRLSRDRAAAVTQSLVADHGIAAARLIAQGVGPLSPIATNTTEAGKARNRRVELVAQ